MFGHFVITLFNLRLRWKGRDKNIAMLDTATDKEYLENSFSRFEKYTVPSVKNQTCSEFVWLVLFSQDTPKEFVDRITYGGGYCKQFIPLFLTDDEAHNFREYLIKYINNNYSYESWITTRLDNDDAIASTFIEEIQKCFESHNGEYAISFPDGYQYDIKKNCLCRYHFPNNHFTSYVTNTRNKTVYDFGHINLTEQNEVVYLSENKQRWIEIIHGENVYNRMGTINPFNYVKSADLKLQYGVDVTTNNSVLQLIWYYLYFTVRKGWNKRARIGVFLCRKLHIKYKDNRTDR